MHAPVTYATLRRSVPHCTPLSDTLETKVLASTSLKQTVSAALFVATLLAGLGPIETALATPVPSEHGAQSSETLQTDLASGAQTDLLPTTLQDAVSKTAIPLSPSVITFYQHRSWTPVWFSGSPDASQRLNDLKQAFSEVALQGLTPPRLPSQPLDPAARELWITQTMLDLARALSGGSLSIPITDSDPTPRIPDQTLLATVTQADLPGRALLGLAPHTSLYKDLIKALSVARQQAAEETWVKVPAHGKLEPGDIDAEVPFLRERLAAEGFYHADDAQMSSTAYDLGLEDAVKAFQDQYGLDIDGIVGKGTRRALNISPADRVDQIKVNLDRLRHMPRDLGDRYVLVNIAAFKAWIYQKDRPVFETPIIVGKGRQQTPSFSNTIRSVELNPSWEVPRSIGLKEILPKLAKDPSYLETANMDVYDGWQNGGVLVDPTTVDWVDLAQKGRLPYRFSQRPGPKNSLGQLKILFPNKHDIYLHDTPARGLFSRRIRAFSHGCMRVGKPVALASEILGIDPDRLEDTIKSGETKRLRVRHPLPIHITYLTVWTDPDSGQTRFSSDIYGRDATLMAQLHPLNKILTQSREKHGTRQTNTQDDPTASHPLPRS